MDSELKNKIISAHRALPRGMFRSDPATEEELQKFEAVHGVIPPDYRWYLSECGGGGVGAESVDNIHELWQSHANFKKESEIAGGWQMKGVFIIGYDGWGNPFGIDHITSKIMVEDHDVGDIIEMAPSFEHFLVEGLRSHWESPPQPPPLPRKLPDLEDCEKIGHKHHWFNIDNETSGCYKCRVVLSGQLWRRR